MKKFFLTFMLIIIFSSHNTMAKSKFRLKEACSVGVAFTRLESSSISNIIIDIETLDKANGFSVEVYLLESTNGIEPNKMYDISQYTILGCKDIVNIKAGSNIIPFNLMWDNPKAVIFVMISPLKPYTIYSIEENAPKILENGNVVFINRSVNYCGPTLSGMPASNNCFYAVSDKNNKISYSNVRGLEYKHLPAITITH